MQSRRQQKTGPIRDCSKQSAQLSPNLFGGLLVFLIQLALKAPDPPLRAGTPILVRTNRNVGSLQLATGMQDYEVRIQPTAGRLPHPLQISDVPIPFYDAWDVHRVQQKSYQQCPAM
jgi:hypothetical protein